MKYKLEEISPRVFLVSCKNGYDLAMLFLRYQEFYESPNPKFRGKNFTILDYMEWYTKKSPYNIFSYTKDWAGFNFPSYILESFYKNNNYGCHDIHIHDFNKYDWLMHQIYHRIVEITKGEKFYIMGANDKKSIKHELSHAFFYLRDNYKKESTALVKKMNPELRNLLLFELKRVGYTKNVLTDEVVAYMSTGIPESFKIKNETKDRKPFIKLFEEQFKHDK